MALRLHAKNAYFQTLALARVDAVLRAVRARRGEVLVLNMHRVSPIPRPYWPSMPPEAFSALVADLVRACDVVRLDQLAYTRPTGRMQVVLSFDDGCRDFIEYALPILTRWGVAVNHNVIGQSVETGRPPWSIALTDALAAADPRRVRRLSVPGFSYRLTAEDDWAKALYGHRLTNYLKLKSPPEREKGFGDIQALLAQTDPAAFTPMMSADDVRSLAGAHEIGCHSYSHESMARMSVSEFDAEIERCEAFFAALELPLSIFAFPNGSYRPDQVQALLARGLEHVLLVDDLPTRPTARIHPRFGISGDSTAEIRLRAMGCRTPVPRRRPKAVPAPA